MNPRYVPLRASPTPKPGPNCPHLRPSCPFLVPTISFSALMPIPTILSPIILGPSSSTVTNTNTLLSPTIPLPTKSPSLPIAPLPLPLLANLTPCFLCLLTKNILPLQTIRRFQTQACFTVLADVDGGTALVATGLPVGDVAKAHFGSEGSGWSWELKWTWIWTSGRGDVRCDW